MKKSELKALIREVMEEVTQYQSIADIAFKSKFVSPEKEIISTHRLDDFRVDGSGRLAFEKGVQDWLNKHVEKAKKKGKVGISLTLVPGTLQILTIKQ